MNQYIEFLCFVLLLGVASATNGRHDPSVEIELSAGKIRGSLMKSRFSRRIYAFRGIRYAEAPVGDLRFRPAVPVEHWNGTFDASREGPSCPQSYLTSLMSEDCLRLNVYTTRFSSGHSTVERPVIVFIHPGSNEFGSGQSFFVGPNYLLDHDVVLVTINYRLAALGFLSTGDALAPGNLGLKDQVTALRWVKKHIKNFGGNPNLVTIAGCSAGARDVSAHLFSLMSYGLFHRVIIMSAAVISQARLPHNQKNLAIKQARLLGCPTDTTERMINCLKTKPAEEFAKSQNEFREWNWAPVVAWFPVVEPDIPGLERFLTAQPMDMIREGKFHSVPTMIGITKTEYEFEAAEPVSEAENGNFSMFDDINANWTKIAPIAFYYERNTEKSIEISNELRRFYLHDKPISLDNWKGYSHACSDAVEGFAVDRTARMLAETSTEPVWYYEFSYGGHYSLYTWPNGTIFSKNAGHADDMTYIFYRPISFPWIDENAPEHVTVEKMTAIWANFAKTGQPIPKNNRLFTNVTWPRLTPQNKAYLDIGNELVMKTRLYEDRYNVWEKLFPLKLLPKSSLKGKCCDRFKIPRQSN